jgi:hypothetical protein
LPFGHISNTAKFDTLFFHQENYGSWNWKVWLHCLVSLSTAFWSAPNILCSACYICSLLVHLKLTVQQNESFVWKYILLPFSISLYIYLCKDSPWVMSQDICIFFPHWFTTTYPSIGGGIKWGWDMKEDDFYMEKTNYC